MSRPVFGKKSCQLQRPRVDRFMPPRESFADERRRGSWRFSTADETVNIWEAKHRKQKNYQKRFNEVFELESISDAHLTSPHDQAFSRPWPCAPRKKGYLSSVESILDLPTYSYASFPEILDWSSHNILVAALGRNYHLFSWKSQCVIGQGVTQFPILCCKFDPEGSRLLIATDSRFLEIHDAAMIKAKQVTGCRCFWDDFRFCTITSLDWSPTGNSFVTGCTLGKVITFESKLFVSTRWKILRGSPILTVKISPDARFVAVVLINSSLVHVLKWPTLETHSTMKSQYTVKTIAWHPWRSALLGVGVMTDEQEINIAMWDTHSTRVRDVTLGLGNHYYLDVMLFSHRTGELVLSLWNTDRAVTMTKTYAQLLVMSDENTVVDQSGEGKNVLDRVRTMVFSPDGTKLATATADEDLIIWNFLPEEKSNNTRCKKFYALPLYLDEITYQHTIR